MKTVICLTITGLCLTGLCFTAGSQVKDNQGNVYPVKIMPDGKTWMTANLALDLPGSYCYENRQQHCEKYGRLYTWKLAQEGCKSLGEGWRLPAYEEWKLMARHYGGIFGDSNDSGKTAFKALLPGGNAAFNAVLGGGRRDDKDEYKRIDAHGFYWTATENEPGMAWYCNFGKGSGKFFIQPDGKKGEAYSVRCVKDVVK